MSSNKPNNRANSAASGQLSGSLSLAPSVMSKMFLWREFDGFDQLRMAEALKMTATQCRAALQDFCHAQMVTYTGLSDGSVETWSVTKTGRYVWHSGRIRYRVTKETLQHFLAVLPQVVNAMRPQEVVERVVVGGGWLTGGGYGPFLLGLQLARDAGSPDVELQLIQAVLHLFNPAKSFEIGSPIVMVYQADDSGIPQRLRLNKCIYQKASEPLADISSLPVETALLVDEHEKHWAERVALYAGALDFVGADRFFSSSVLASLQRALDGKEKPPSKYTPTEAARQFPLVKPMLYYEMEFLEAPVKCELPAAVWPRDGLNSPPAKAKLLMACNDWVADRKPFAYDRLPGSWQSVAEQADYWYSSGQRQLLPGGVLYKQLNDRSWPGLPAWMDAQRIDDIAQLLAIKLNEFKTGAQAVVRPKQRTPTEVDYHAMFDLTLSTPQCVALIRQPRQTVGNLKAAREFFDPYLLGSSRAAVAIYDIARFYPASFCTATRPATDAEVALFQKVAEQQSRTINFICQVAEQTILGHRSRDTGAIGSDFQLKAFPPGQLDPVVIERSEEDKLRHALAAMDKQSAARLAPWWFFIDSTLIASVCQVCIESPASSPIATLFNPGQSWAFSKISGSARQYEARIEGPGWYVRLHGLGGPGLPEMFYGRGTLVGREKLRVANFDTWRGMASDVSGLFYTLTLLKRMGLEEFVQAFRQHLRVAEGAQSDEAGEFEAILNMAVTGWLAHYFRHLSPMLCRSPIAPPIDRKFE